MSEPATINIRIGNRSYPLKVQNADENAMREAEKLINERLKAYETAYAVKDPQDLLAMCAIQLAAEHLHLKGKVAKQQSMMNKEISEISQLINLPADT